MVTPAPVPVNPVTSDPDLERLRSSPFPHYDPEQHPWAPSPPSQVNGYPHTIIVTTYLQRILRMYAQCVCTYVCTYVYTYVCTKCMYVRMYTCMYVCMYVCIKVCMYTTTVVVFTNST